MADDSLVIDLSNYKDRVGSRLPEGDYKVQVEDVEMSQSSAGNSMINLFYRVIGGEHADATLIDRLVLTEKSLFRVVSFMQAIGMPTPKKKVRVSPRKFIGKVLMVTVEDGEPYMGRVRSEVRQHSRVKSSESVGEDLPDLDGSAMSDDADDLPEGTPEDVEETTEEPKATKAKKTEAEPEESASDDSDSDESDDDIDVDEIEL